ncbi:MAG: PorV/PorQ family protein, partial [Endomicrobiales bacterium]|nr:PorV/PorQ family protein [Endomicrobiales bacterium]
MKRTNQLTIMLILVFLTIGYAYGLDLGFAKQDGGQPGAFLSYGAGARALGMGKTFVGVADDASTVYWNPAGLGQMKQREVTALYASLYENTGYSFIGYAHPLNNKSGALGLAVVNLDSKGFQLRDAYNYEMGEAGVSETAGILSFGRELVNRNNKPFLTAGASVKVVRQIVDSQSATGYGADIGALCRVMDNMTVGLSMQNVIAPKLTLYQTADEYPLSITAGAGYKLLKNKLLVACDVNKTAKRDYKLHIGGEYELAKIFSFRAGIDETELA